jgi:hypothetical protein
LIYPAMTAELPRCAVCRTAIAPGQNVVFRRDGGVHHVACPEVTCPVCSLPVDGAMLVHGNCWMRPNDTVSKPPVKVMPTERDGIISIVRAKLVTGTLPRGVIQTVWVGFGTGRQCNVCDKPITSAEVEHEANLIAGSTLRLHRHCLGVWQAEVAK